MRVRPSCDIKADSSDFTDAFYNIVKSVRKSRAVHFITRGSVSGELTVK